MNKITIIVSIIGIIGTISSICFAYVACKKNELKEEYNDGKHEGTIFSDINHIKECVDRVEKNLNKVDEKYRGILERLVKTEVVVSNLIKMVDDIYKVEGG